MSLFYFYFDSSNKFKEVMVDAFQKPFILRYVQVVSHDLSLLLGKSVEARDWLSTVEPRAVRAVMKRIVEDVNLIGK